MGKDPEPAEDAARDDDEAAEATAAEAGAAESKAAEGAAAGAGDAEPEPVTMSWKQVSAGGPASEPSTPFAPVGADRRDDDGETVASAPGMRKVVIRLGEGVDRRRSAIVIGAAALAVTTLSVGGISALLSQAQQPDPDTVVAEALPAPVPVIVTDDELLDDEEITPESMERLLKKARARLKDTIEVGEEVYAAARLSASAPALQELRRALDDGSKLLERKLPDDASDSRREKHLKKLDQARTTILDAASAFTEVRRVPVAELPGGTTTTTDSGTTTTGDSTGGGTGAGTGEDSTGGGSTGGDSTGGDSTGGDSTGGGSSGGSGGTGGGEDDGDSGGSTPDSPDDDETSTPRPDRPSLPGDEPTAEPTTEPTTGPTTEPAPEPTPDPTAGTGDDEAGDGPSAAEPTDAPTATPEDPATPFPARTHEVV